MARAVRRHQDRETFRGSRAGLLHGGGAGLWLPGRGSRSRGGRRADVDRSSVALGDDGGDGLSAVNGIRARELRG